MDEPKKSDAPPSKPANNNKPSKNFSKVTEKTTFSKINIPKFSPTKPTKITTPVKPQASVKKETPKIEKKVISRGEIGYKYVGSESLADLIRKSVPKEMIPTNRLGYILGVVYVVVVIISLLQFPMGAFLSGNIDVNVTVGIPMTFLQFSALHPLDPPIKFGGFFVDLVIYLFISYLIEVLINLILNSKFFKSRREMERRPKILKDFGSKTVGEKIADKIFKKKDEEQKPQNKKPISSTTNSTPAINKPTTTQKPLTKQVPTQKKVTLNLNNPYIKQEQKSTNKKNNFNKPQ